MGAKINKDRGRMIATEKRGEEGESVRDMVAILKALGKRNIPAPIFELKNNSKMSEKLLCLKAMGMSARCA